MVSYGQCGTWIIPKDHQLFDKVMRVSGEYQAADDTPRWRCLVLKSCLTLCIPMDCSTPGFAVLHHLLEFAETRVH